MSDQTKVPGWVRLTDYVTGESMCGQVAAFWPDEDGAGTRVRWMHASIESSVTESPAEVAALIAAAQAAERRARALPVMAAILYAAQAPNGDGQWDCVWTSDGAIRNAAAILDAIERREGE